MWWRETKRVFLITLGIMCIGLGALGLVLPFLQGFLFFALGLFLLMFSSRRFRVWAEVHTRRIPRLHRFIERAEAWLARYIDRPDMGEAAPPGEIDKDVKTS